MLHTLIKKEGINISIHWQDADSSSNAMTEYFPDAEIMICGGHTGKAHKNTMIKLTFSLITTKRSIVKDFQRLIQWSVIVRNGTHLDVVVCQLHS